MNNLEMSKNRKGLQRLMEKVYRERGFDFRDYKESTLFRRLERRLNDRGVKSYTGYSRILDQHPDEYDKLFDDLTINVTSFFRDEVAFKALEEVVIPALIAKGTRRKKPLRIWSAGCATGQEPYSVAMLLIEKLAPLEVSRQRRLPHLRCGLLTGLGKKMNSKDITILATDIDGRALEKAREGVFLRKEVEAIRPAWRRRYFLSQDGGFRAKAALRKLVTFEVHNLVSDPPYQDLDLVVCRNVLIYFSLPLQMQVMRDFYDGLKRGGFLLLGKAEVPVGEGTALFKCLDKKAKLFNPVGSKSPKATAAPSVRTSNGVNKSREDNKRKERTKPDSRARRIIYHGKAYREL